MYSIYLTIMVVFLTGVDSVYGMSSLYYHTYAVARVIANVQEILTEPIASQSSKPLISPKPLNNRIRSVDIQKISLRIIKLIEFLELNHKVPELVEGQIVVLTNPYVDQVPPFKVGDNIKTRIRLVLPEEQFDHQDPRKQWWFFPEGTEAEFYPPRFPFQAIESNNF